jgi:DNA-binding GntR family transcriptional regulator
MDSSTTVPPAPTAPAPRAVVLDALTADGALLRRASTTERVADVLRERITDGSLPPGTRLSEEALSTALGVSRNTLREGFRLLARERIVVHEMNRGVFVRVLDAHDVADIYTVRRALESAGLRAAGTAAPELLRAVGQAVDSGEAAAAAADWPRVSKADLVFHRALAALAGSSRIDEYMTRLLAELRLAFHAVPSPAEFHLPFVPRNRAIGELVAAGVTALAEAELARYLDDSEQIVLAAMAEQQPRP